MRLHNFIFFLCRDIYFQAAMTVVPLTALSLTSTGVSFCCDAHLAAGTIQAAGRLGICTRSRM